MFKILNFLYFLAAVFPFIRSNLMNPETYIEKVSNRMVYHLQQNLVDRMLPVDDSTLNISVTTYGTSVVGDVRFHSGFVASIGKAMIEEKKPGENRGYADDTMSIAKAPFLLCNVSIAYDVQYKLKSKQEGDAIFLIRYGDIRFGVSVVRKHGDIPRGKIEFSSVSSTGRGQNELKVKTDPNTPEVQLIVREFRLNSTFRGKTEKFFPGWTASMQKFLDKAVAEIEFPQIDYAH